MIEVEPAIGPAVVVEMDLYRKELAWNFTKTLSNTVRMPGRLDPIDSLTIKPSWGKRRVDGEAMVLVVSFNLTFNRGD